MKRLLQTTWDNLKHSNIRIIGAPEGEQQQEIENLFEQIIKKKTPQSGKGNRLPGSPGAQNPKEVGPKEGNTKVHHH